MTNLLLSFLFLFFSSSPDSVSFEGNIKMVQETCYETSYFTYFVKNENVRIDKFDDHHILTQSLIVNLKDKQVHILSPSKKLYSQLNINSTPNVNSNDLSILKTQNCKSIDTNVCYQWRVKNIEGNTEIAYWVAQNNFYFFEDLIKILNSIDNSFEYFEKIPDSLGFFPIITVERTLLRKEKCRLSVVQIKNKRINENIFEIPTDFELVKI